MAKVGAGVRVVAGHEAVGGGVVVGASAGG